MKIRNVAVKNWEDKRKIAIQWEDIKNGNFDYWIIECEEHQKSFVCHPSDSVESLTCELMCIMPKDYTIGRHYQFMADRPTEICNGQNGCSTYQDDSTECEKKRNDYSNNQMLWEKY